MVAPSVSSGSSGVGGSNAATFAAARSTPARVGARAGSRRGSGLCCVMASSYRAPHTRQAASAANGAFSNEHGSGDRRRRRDRKRVGSGKSVLVRVDFGGGRCIKKHMLPTHPLTYLD